MTYRVRSAPIPRDAALIRELRRRGAEFPLPRLPHRADLRAEGSSRERNFRQFFINDLGHDEPIILLIKDATSTARNLIARYARRMLIENALGDAVRSFDIDAFSSLVRFKVDPCLVVRAPLSKPEPLVSSETVGRYVFPMAEVAVPRELFQEILRLTLSGGKTVFGTDRNRKQSMADPGL